jgi:hypothetical protein
MSSTTLRDDLTGEKFDRLTVLERLPFDPLHPLHVRYRCRCDCGKETITRAGRLKNGHTRSCGCLVRASLQKRGHFFKKGVQHNPHPGKHLITHGLTYHPLYPTWNLMMARCYRENATGFERYGAIGIKVYEPWHDAGVFIPAILELLGERPPNRTLDRIDNKGNYEPGNVRWATFKEQQTNRRH